MKPPGVPLRHRLKMGLGQSRTLYPVYLKLRNPGKRFPCRETFLTIEGLDRSANTFAWYLARETFPGKLISSHVHNISSIKAGLRTPEPCIILMRNGLDAVVSIAQMYGNRCDDLMVLNGYLQQWLSMYRFVARHLDELVLVEFQQLVSMPVEFVRLMASLKAMRLDGGLAVSVVESAQAKIRLREKDKADLASSLPREERQAAKASLKHSVEQLPAAAEANELYRWLGEQKADLRELD